MTVWRREHSQLTTLSADEVWRRWVSASAWALDDPGVDWAFFERAPSAGSRGKVKSHGAPAQSFTFTALERHRRMDFRMRLPLGSVTITHSMMQSDAGLTTTHGVEIAGPLRALYVLAVGRRLAAGLPTVHRRVLDAAMASRTDSAR